MSVRSVLLQCAIGLSFITGIYQCDAIEIAASTIDAKLIDKTLSGLPANFQLSAIDVEKIKESLSKQQVIYDIPLVAVFMVKDEAHIIKQTLEPYISAGIKHFFIFDTGSTDTTIEVAKNYFAERGITQAFIGQEPFVDFATSRNRGLDLAAEKFPTAAFFTMPDAEWYLRNGEKLLEFCKQHMQEKVPHSYSIRIMNSTIDFYTTRLIRNDGVSRFVGVVHEVIMPTSGDKVPQEVYFELGGTQRGAEKSRKRWERDIVMLLKSYQENPNDSRTTFYLAQTYECLGDLENAHKYYQIRSTMPGWDEENFITIYRLASITERLAKINKGHTWDEAMALYLKAHGMRSHRAEPLMKIAAHYWDAQNFPLAFLFARRAVELPYPKDDVLFVDKSMYDFDRYEMISKTAWHVGECAIGEKATRHILTNYHEFPQMYRNLATYLECNKGSDLWGCNMACKK